MESQNVIRFTPFRSRYLTSFLFGASFAAGWTPCVGVVLGAVLGLAATAPGVSFLLLLAYSLGLALPFLISGLFADTIIRAGNKYGWISRPVTVFFGLILVVVGVFIFTQTLGAVSNVQAIVDYFIKVIPADAATEIMLPIQ